MNFDRFFDITLSVWTVIDNDTGARRGLNAAELAAMTDIRDYPNPLLQLLSDQFGLGLTFDADELIFAVERGAANNNFRQELTAMCQVGVI